ncbi:rRNA maturation RNase YbeY [bacterium A37T11]|nr:rRNA maturation RNase YbeY [bacterium A37T11]
MKTESKHIHFFTQDIDFTLKKKGLVREWMVSTIQSEGFKKIQDLNIIFCSDEYLFQINVQYLNHHTYTDIITFDNSEKNDTICGDIFISIDRIKENSQSYGTGMKDELDRVIIHGVLHLCGYKDKGSENKKEMTAKENHYLSQRP